MQKSNIMQGSDAIAVLNAKPPVLAPLAPKSGITTVTGIAPPAPAFVTPPAPPTVEDEVMKARMERAELAIQRQRERQAKEKAEKEKLAEDGGGKVLVFLILATLLYSHSQVLKRLMQKSRQKMKKNC
jgi:hypothetical protein